MACNSLRRAGKRAKVAIVPEAKPQGEAGGQLRTPLHIAHAVAGREKYEVEAIVARELRKTANMSKVLCCDAWDIINTDC